MRELKFRAWDKENVEMVYSDKKQDEYWFNLDTGVARCCVEYTTYDSCGDEYIDYDDLGNIMQYTGLKDKNGIEIYEGDIVKLKPHHKEKERDLLNFLIEDAHYKIEYINASFALINTITLEIDSYLGDYGENALEVTGNVYEDKDLLK